MQLPIEAGGVELEVREGDVLIQQGSVPGQVFWVAEGKLESVVVDGQGQSRWLGEVHQGEFFGEMAALTGKPASATVRAITRCRLRSFDYETFFALIEGSPAWNRELLRSISLRSQRLYLPPTRAIVIAVAPWSEGVDAGEFMHRLGPCLARHARHAILRMEEGRDWSSDLKHALESHAFVFLVGDMQDDNWRLFCEGEADRWLCIGRAGREPLPQRLGAASGSTREMALVLLHQDRKSAPRGTKAWLETGEFGIHYHIATEMVADWERLGRCISGNAVGLVCTGGGARGAAHLGLIAAFQEVGIPIDYLVGTSAGALMTVCHCMDMPRQAYFGFLEEISRKRRQLTDYTFPFLSLLAGRQFDEILKQYSGDWQIEDLWLPFACISSSLQTGRVVVHRRGALYSALKASAAIPGIFPPKVVDGDLLVDGGVLNNAPTDVTRQFPRGKVILSDVSNWAPIQLRGRYPDTSSGWRMLLHYLNPFRRDRFRPALPTIILRSYELSALHLQQEKLQNHQPDLVIRLPVHGFGTLDFNSVRRIWDVGYGHGKEMGDGWRRELLG